jgi:type I restriction enzyme S subunit
LEEQHRIVAKVNELIGLCDRLEEAQKARESQRDRLSAASLARLNNGADAEAFRNHARFHLRHLPHLTTRPNQIPALRQTILDLAVGGRLVPHDANDEPVGCNNNWLRASDVDTPVRLPKGWKWFTIGSLLKEDSQNGYSKKPDDAPDGIPILRISAGTVRTDGIVAEEEHKLIGGVSVAHQTQYGLQPGDLLACRFNGNRSYVGRLSLYRGYLRLNPIYPDKLIRLRLDPQSAIPRLVQFFGESRLVRDEIERYCATTVGNWGISATNLKLVRIPLPPLAEQHRIVTKVEELTAVCDRLETQLTTAQTDSRRLLEAVLHEALAPMG